MVFFCPWTSIFSFQWEIIQTVRGGYTFAFATFILYQSLLSFQETAGRNSPHTLQENDGKDNYILLTNKC